MTSRKDILLQMLSETPGDAFLIYALALEEHKEGDLPAATKRLESLVESHPDYLGSYYQLGKFYEEHNNREKAMSTYKVGIGMAKVQKADKMARELAEALFILDDDD